MKAAMRSAAALAALALCAFAEPPIVATATQDEEGKLSPIAEVIDARTLRIGDQKVRLWGYDAPEPGARCFWDGKPYDCHADAVEKLRELVTDAEAIRCEPKSREEGVVVARCAVTTIERVYTHENERVDDLAFELIQEGLGVEVVSESGGAYDKATRTAKASFAGVWNGGEWVAARRGR